jgi:Flp pilus assembly protein TadG
MRNKGYVIITIAILLVVLLGFSALAVDLGIMYSVRTSAQRVADAAALAGAFTFVVEPNAAQPDTAIQHARQTALNNNILGDPVVAADVTINVDVPNRLVTVDVEHNQYTFFARVLGSTTADIRARALAEASANATSSYCVKPWFIPNTVLSPQNPCTACTAAEVLISGGAVTPFAQLKLGTEFNLKPQQPSGAMAPGQFFAIQLPGSVGGNDYRNNIRTCPPNAVPCNQFYSVETGNMVGPTKQGVSDLIGNPPTDTYISLGRYRRSDGTIGDTSKGLIVAPIWDACNMPDFCPANQFPTGTNVNLKVIGFALVFLEGIEGNDVVGRLINVFPCGNAPLETDETGPYSIPVRLVRPAM